MILTLTFQGHTLKCDGAIERFIYDLQLISNSDNMEQNRQKFGTMGVCVFFFFSNSLLMPENDSLKKVCKRYYFGNDGHRIKICSISTPSPLSRGRM